MGNMSEGPGDMSRGGREEGVVPGSKEGGRGDEGTRVWVFGRRSDRFLLG